MLRAFVQARMSSSRFPGKVLAPCAGKPLVDHVLGRVAEVVPRQRITVATSAEHSDDPLARYLAVEGISVFRGELDDVFGRFQACLARNPCEWFFRVCCDSPLLDVQLMRRALEERGDCDLVTNVLVRTYPKGQTVELLRAETFAAIDPAPLSAEQREHLTRIYYDQPDRFRIRSLESSDRVLAALGLAVDTLDDLRRVERALEPPAGGTP